MNSPTRTIYAIFLILAASCALAQPNPRPVPRADDLSFRFLGPAVGNRIASVVSVPGDPKIIYAGAASGGVWKSTDGGARFNPVFDKQDVQAIGALAIAPTDPKIVWAGTGEAWVIRDSDLMGDGIYKSIDAGATWEHMGLNETGRIGRIIVHPKNPDIVYACAVGRATGPQQERGVFRTRDGGKTWDRVLFVDPDTGCSGLTLDPNDPDTLFAGMWQVVMHSWAMFSGGPSSGVYSSHDGGSTWTSIEGHGLPKSPVGKIDVAIAPSNAKRVYALIQTADQGSLWRSDDGGVNWVAQNWQRELIGRAGYYLRLAISPANADEILVANSSFWLSIDGGKSFKSQRWGGDTHDIWIDPQNPDRFFISDDGGLYTTLDHGKTGTRITLPIGQMYHVAVDDDVPYKVYSNMQDSTSMRGPANGQEGGPNVPGQGAPGSGFGGGRRNNIVEWEHALGGCESGFTLPDITNTDTVWATCYGNQVTRYDSKTKLARSVSPWLHTLDSEPNVAKYRCHWSPPLAIDPFDHNTVYYGCQVIFRTTNGGNTWNIISPDLSTQDPKIIVSSGGIVGDNLGQFYGALVFAIAPSEIQKGLIWAGTNDGKVWYTRDGGGKWNDVSANIQGLPPLGVVSKIEPSHFDPGTAYVCVDFHLADNRDPWLYKTTDYGKTWAKISGDLPAGGAMTYARSIAENPNRKGMLFAGTGHAIYYSMDDGGSWKQLTQGLPAAAVTWIVVQKKAHDLVVSTYGRGLYVMENITPLEQGLMENPTESVRLVAPRPTWRMVKNAKATIDFTLSAQAKNPVELEVLDGKGAVIRKQILTTGHPGLNRVTWDMRHEPPRFVALRTTPAENPHIWEEPRFDKADTRPVLHWGIREAQVGPIAAPGKYTIRLTVDGTPYTQPIEILRPPDSHGNDGDLSSAVSLQLKVRDDISAVSDMTNQIEWMRRQLQDAGPQSAELARKIAAIDRKMQDVEFQLISRADAMSDDKFFITANKLYLNFIWLNAEIGTGGGDVAGTADYGPTETGIALVLDLERQLAKVKAEYKRVMDRDVPDFNKSIEGSPLKPLKTTGAPAPPPLPPPTRF
jgi:photosystem II stability/assembly factor-like uncharacterized protein